eukprot:gene4087-5115_t
MNFNKSESHDDPFNDFDDPVLKKNREEKLKKERQDDIDYDKNDPDKQNIDLYSVLNVSRDATNEEIKNSYKKLVFTYHPDKQTSEELRELTQEKFSLITLAKDTLSDPKLRAVYDKFGLAGLKDSKAIVHKYEKVDSLLSALKRILEEQDEEKYISVVRAEGYQKISIGYVTDYDYFWVKSLTSTQSFSVNSGRYGSFNIAPRVQKKNDQVNIGLGAVFNCHLTPKYHLTTSTDISEMGVNINRIGIRSLINPNTVGAINFTFLKDYPIEGNASVTRILSPNSQATVTASLGRAEQRLQLKWRRVIEKRVLDIQLSAGTISGMEMVLTRELPIDKKTTLSFSVSAHRDGYSWLGNSSSFGSFGTTVYRQSKYIDTSFSMRMDRSKFVYTLGLHHKYQTLEIPLPIFTEITLFHSFLFFTVPSVLLSCIKLFIVNPLLKRQEQKRLEETKSKFVHATLESKRKALADIQLMRQVVEKKVLHERTKKGLIIQEALYGKLNEKSTDPEFPANIDVTIPLQFLVEDSKLQLHPNKKSDLLGFWDPAIGEEKQLKVTYFFQDKLHRVIVGDNDPLMIPLRCMY